MLSGLYTARSVPYSRRLLHLSLFYFIQRLLSLSPISVTRSFIARTLLSFFCQHTHTIKCFPALSSLPPSPCRSSQAVGVQYDPSPYRLPSPFKKLTHPLPLAVYAADCTRTYTVVDGDICDSISAANNASTYQLAAVNSGVIDSTCSNLSPDSSICLGTEGEDCSTTYVVQSGDTCDDISSVFGINSTLLWTNNPNIDSECSNIYIGEVRPFMSSFFIS